MCLGLIGLEGECECIRVCVGVSWMMCAQGMYVSRWCGGYIWAVCETVCGCILGGMSFSVSVSG